MKPNRDFDELGLWSLIKLQILLEYSTAYANALKNQAFERWYIDAFAGAGIHKLKGRNGFVPGSPINALKVVPPFHRHFLIDLDNSRIAGLRRLIGHRPDVTLIAQNCNSALVNDVFPNVEYKRFRRALCFLDPYGLTLEWRVIAAAAAQETIDVFINFPIMDMNRNVLWRDSSLVSSRQKNRLTLFWGDTSWEQAAYSEQHGLFGDIDLEKQSNDKLAEAFRERLKKVAGFSYVPRPIAMRTNQGSTIFYLFFASQNQLAEKIASQIIEKYRAKGGMDVLEQYHRVD